MYWCVHQRSSPVKHTCQQLQSSRHAHHVLSMLHPSVSLLRLRGNATLSVRSGHRDIPVCSTCCRLATYCLLAAVHHYQELLLISKAWIHQAHSHTGHSAFLTELNLHFDLFLLLCGFARFDGVSVYMSCECKTVCRSISCGESDWVWNSRGRTNRSISFPRKQKRSIRFRCFSLSS